MFYFLSKILVFVLSPYYWIITCIFLGILIKNKVWKKRWFVTAILIYFIFGNLALVNVGYKKMEVPPLMQSEISQPFEYAVLLGGGFVSMNELFPDRVVFNESANRLTEAMELFYSGRIKKLIISGGAGGIGTIKNIEARHAETFLKEIHFPDSALFIEAESKNTYENAINVKKILDSLDYTAGVLIITSAYHMNRALATFRKQGISCVAYAADYEQRSKFEFWDYVLPNTAALEDWKLLLKEYVGYFVYRLKGYL